MTYSLDSIQGGIARLVSFGTAETAIYVSVSSLPEECGEGDLLEECEEGGFLHLENETGMRRKGLFLKTFQAIQETTDQ